MRLVNSTVNVNNSQANKEYKTPMSPPAMNTKDNKACSGILVTFRVELIMKYSTGEITMVVIQTLSEYFN